MECTKRCKYCDKGTYDKSTGTVRCRILKRVILVDKAENCREYNTKAEIKRLMEQGKLDPNA